MNAQQLIEINNDFYRQIAPFFSQTRQMAWRGWEELPLPLDGAAILDVAAGNSRFARYLQSKNIDIKNYLAIDNCQELFNLGGMDKDQFIEIDLLTNFLEGTDWLEKLPAKKFHYIICSAFFHHIPELVWREKLLQDLAGLLAPQGILVISFWQFMYDQDLAKRVIKDLGNHDYLLDWKSGMEAIRYCHHFSDEEIKHYLDLMATQDLTLIKDYCADGSNGRMNRYLVWQKN
ncbi:MAG: class I SAM-dependent methyltransferase [bacterium]|nr:class I SAM-dependent methyltransferase [bacterium]